MKKKISFCLSIIMFVFCFVACGNSKSTTSNNETSKNSDPVQVKMIIPDGITAIACAKLVKENTTIDSNYNMEYSIEKSSENVVSAVLKGDADLAVVPSNVSATQYNKTGNYKIAGTIGWGSFYLVSTGDESTIDDLKGKEIYNIGKNLTPDIVMKSILKDKGYNLDADFNFSYVNGVTELAPMVISGKTKYSVLPEPALSQVSSKNQNAKVILNLNDEWKKLNNSEYGYPQSTLIISKNFYENNKDFANKLISEVKESCIFASEKNSDLPTYCEEIGVSTDKNIVIKAMDKANISYTDIKDCYKEYKTYFEKLSSFDASTIGGKVPDDEIFLEK